MRPCVLLSLPEVGGVLSGPWLEADTVVVVHVGGYWYRCWRVVVELRPGHIGLRHRQHTMYQLC